MTGRIQKGDLPALDFNLVSSDMLRDTASFTTGNIGMPYGVQQRCFTVIHMTQDRYDRRSWFQPVLLFLSDHPSPQRQFAEHQTVLPCLPFPWCTR